MQELFLVACVGLMKHRYRILHSHAEIQKYSPVLKNIYYINTNKMSDSAHFTFVAKGLPVII